MEAEGRNDLSQCSLAGLLLLFGITSDIGITQFREHYLGHTTHLCSMSVSALDSLHLVFGHTFLWRDQGEDKPF